MGKVLKIGFVFFIICINSYLGFLIQKRISEKKKVTDNMKLLPVFNFRKNNNIIFKNENILNCKGRVIFNYFNPDCEHCQYMATSFVKNKTKFQNITLLMVTNDDSASVAKFESKYQLYTLSNLILLRDSQSKFYSIFGSATVPSFFIYEQEKLVKKIIGETKIENLLSN